MFEGTGVAIATTFGEDLSIDFESLEKLIDHTIAGGVDYIVALGTTGETATLSKEEKIEIIEFCKKKIANRVSLVIGIGGNNTTEVIDTIRSTDTTGIAGILSVAPYYNKPTQKGLFEHFKAIANSTDLPVMIYNVPGRTCSNIDADTAIDLANECSNILAVKEASGNLSQIMNIIKRKPKGFGVISGDDALTLPLISLGAIGAVSVVANSHPKEFNSLVKAALVGDVKTAKEIQYQLLNYINCLFEEGSPSGLKAALEIMDICKNYVRLPLTPISDDLLNKIKVNLAELQA